MKDKVKKGTLNKPMKICPISAVAQVQIALYQCSMLIFSSRNDVIAQFETFKLTFACLRFSEKGFFFEIIKYHFAAIFVKFPF